MKKLVLVFMILNLTSGAFAQPFVEADTLRINGHMALWLGSSDYYQDGFNYGRLLGHRIKPFFENYLIPVTFGNVAGYHEARLIFDQYFVVDDKYIEMTQGMINGMEYAGIDLFSLVLDDTLTYKDILIANSVPDYMSFPGKSNYIIPGCSTLTSWGEATINSPELMGETVINRYLDWDDHPHIINNPLIIIWVTGDPQKQSFVTFGFMGLIGALSGINEHGVATFQNVGNFFINPIGTGFYPVNLAQRNGLEAADYNGDGVCSPRDITDAVKAHNLASTYIINSAGPSSLESAAESLEIHNSFGYSIRTKANNPLYFGDNLVATNHFRLLKPAVFCSRYKRISDSLQVSNQLDVNRNWNVLKTAGHYTTLQTIQFIPTQNIIRFSFAEVGTPAYLIEPYEVWMDTLFTMFNVGMNEKNLNRKSHVRVFPNPGKDLISIVIKPEAKSKIVVVINDQTGRVVFREEMLYETGAGKSFKWDTGKLAAGVYFAVVEITDNVTRIAQQESRKIVVMK